MNSARKWLFAAPSAIAIILGACTDRRVEPLVTRETALSSYAVGTTLKAFRASWPVRSGSEIAIRAHNAAEVIAQTSLPQMPPPTKALSTPFAARPSLTLRYYATHDELKIVDTSLVVEPSPGLDVGEAAANAEMRKVLAELVARAVVDARHFDPETAKISKRRAGYQSKKTGSKQEWVVEYRFVLLRQLDGLPFINAFVTIGIHRSGKRSSLRIGGAVVDSVWSGAEELPTSAGYTFSRGVATSDINHRFMSGFTNPANVRVGEERLLYTMPTNTAAAIIEPLYTYLYVETYGAGKVVGNVTLVGYSVADGSRPAQVFFGDNAPPDTVPPTAIVPKSWK